MPIQGHCLMLTLNWEINKQTARHKHKVILLNDYIILMTLMLHTCLGEGEADHASLHSHNRTTSLTGMLEESPPTSPISIQHLTYMYMCYPSHNRTTLSDAYMLFLCKVISKRKGNRSQGQNKETAYPEHVWDKTQVKERMPTTLKTWRKQDAPVICEQRQGYC